MNHFSSFTFNHHLQGTSNKNNVWILILNSQALTKIIYSMIVKQLTDQNSQNPFSFPPRIEHPALHLTLGLQMPPLPLHTTKKLSVFEALRRYAQLLLDHLASASFLLPNRWCCHYNWSSFIVLCVATHYML